MLINKKQLMHISALFLYSVSLANAMNDNKNPSHVKNAISEICQSEALRRAWAMHISPSPDLLDGTSARIMQRIYVPDVISRFYTERISRRPDQALFLPLPTQSSPIFVDCLKCLIQNTNPLQMRKEGASDAIEMLCGSIANYLNAARKLRGRAPVRRAPNAAAILSLRERVPDAAGILLCSIDDNGVPVALIGERDDFKGWCGMGGSCDPGDVFPYVTAARETSEETVNVFAFPPESVALMPYHDTQLPSSRIFRTYIARCKMVPEVELNKRLETAQGTSREYGQFKWVPLTELIKIANGSTSQETTTSSSSAATPDRIKLAPDFEETLRQVPILDTLHSIIKQHKEQCAETCSRGSADQPQISFGELRERCEIALQTIQDQEKVFGLSPVHEQDDASTSGVTSSSAADSAQSRSSAPTRALLKIILGPGYKEGDDIGNLRQFLLSFYPCSKSEREKRFSGTGFEEELRILADFLKFEEQEYKKGNVVGYHGTKGEFLFFYKYIWALSSMLTGRNVVDLSPGLKNSHVAFVNPRTGELFHTIDEILTPHGEERYVFDHYGKDHENMMLFVNPMLILGPTDSSEFERVFSKSTSSSIRYFLENHSVGFSSFQNWAMETLVMLGMHPAYAGQCVTELASMYTQFFGGKENNGAMLAVSVPQAQVRTHTRLGGYEQDSGSILDMYHSVFDRCKQYEGKPGFLELSTEKQQEIKELTTEARIFLDPTMGFTVKSSWRYPLSPEEQTLFDDGLKTLVQIHTLRLLLSNTNGLPNVFVTPNNLLPPQLSLLPLRPRFAEAYKARFARPLIISPINPDIFGWLVIHNCRDVIINLLQASQVKLDISAPAFHNNFLKSFFNGCDYFQLNLLSWLEKLRPYSEGAGTAITATDQSFFQTMFTPEDQKYIVACFSGDYGTFESLVIHAPRIDSDIKPEDAQKFIELFGRNFNFDQTVLNRRLKECTRDYRSGESDRKKSEILSEIKAIIQILHAEKLDAGQRNELMCMLLEDGLSQAESRASVVEEITEVGEITEEEKTAFLNGSHSSLSPEQLNKLITDLNVKLLDQILQDPKLTLLNIPEVCEATKRIVYSHFWHFLQQLKNPNALALVEKTFGSLQGLFRFIVDEDNPEYNPYTLVVQFILEKPNNVNLVSGAISDNPEMRPGIKRALLFHHDQILDALSDDEGRADALRYLLNYAFGTGSGASSSSSATAATAIADPIEKFKQQIEEFKKQVEIYKQSDNYGEETDISDFKELYDSRREEFNIMMLNGNFFAKVMRSALHDADFFGSLLNNTDIQPGILKYLKVDGLGSTSDFNKQNLLAQKLYDVLGKKKFSEILKEENNWLAGELIDCFLSYSGDGSSWIASAMTDPDIKRAIIMQSSWSSKSFFDFVKSNPTFLGNTPGEFVSTLKTLSNAPQILASLAPPYCSELTLGNLDSYFNAALRDSEIRQLFGDYITSPDITSPGPTPLPRWVNPPILIEKLYDNFPEKFYKSLQQSQDIAYEVLNRVVQSEDNDLITEIFSDKTIISSEIQPFNNASRLVDFLNNAFERGINPNGGLNAVREFLKTNVLDSKIGNLDMTFGEWLLKCFTLDPAGKIREVIQWLGIS